MNRSLLVAAATASLVLGGSAVYAQQQQQQRMPSSPPPAQGGSMNSGAGQQPTTGATSGSTMREQNMRGDRSTMRSERKLDSIASGLNECQIKPQDERQACMDQVIRENGG